MIKSVLTKTLHEWKRNQRNGKGLPTKFVVKLAVVLKSKQPKIIEFEKFCNENKIEFIVE